MSLCFQVSLHRFSLEGAFFRGRTGWRGDSRLSGALHTWSVLQYENSFRKVKPCQTCTWELTGNCYLVQSNPFRGDKLRQVTRDCLLTFVSEKSRYFKFAAHTHGRVNFESSLPSNSSLLHPTTLLNAFLIDKCWICCMYWEVVQWGWIFGVFFFIDIVECCPRTRPGCCNWVSVKKMETSKLDQHELWRQLNVFIGCFLYPMSEIVELFRDRQH